MLKSLLTTASAVAILALGSVSTQAAGIVFGGGIDSIPGVAGFVTNGDDMAGMTVKATFSDASTETLVWATTGVGNGGVLGTEWSVSVSGDTFNDLAWHVSVTRAGVELSTLELKGAPGLVLFDIDPPNGTFIAEPGTPGSATGKRFASNLADDGGVTATYTDQVEIGAGPPVGDEWHTLTIDFTGSDGFIAGDFAFTQDADNDERIDLPEPATLGLFGLGMLGLGVLRRRRR